MYAARAVFSFFAVALSCACVNKESVDPVVARVNGASITRAQLAAGVERAINAPGASERSVLEALIDQRLLVQQSLAEELDRSPAVVQAIDAARAQILAQAWISALGQTHQPNAFAVHSFYVDNPLLFAQRRVYRVVELHVPAPDPAAAATLQASRDPLQAAGVLSARGVRFEIGTADRHAEELPAGLLEALAATPVKGAIVTRTGDGISLLQLLERREAPLSEAEAGERIARMLAARSLGQVATREVERLRRTARIEYAEGDEPQRASLGGPSSRSNSARTAP